CLHGWRCAGFRRSAIVVDEALSPGAALSVAEGRNGETFPETGVALIAEANRLVHDRVVAHEHDDEGNVYPQLARVLRDRHGPSAMSRARRETLHLARCSHTWRRTCRPRRSTVI